MKKTSKNNKGFSLVELIVVVLIMAIIAVSLAPQVMKWVDRSRQANDASNYDAIYAAAQLAVIAAPDYSGNITITKTADVALSGTDTGNAFANAMEANLPGWNKIRITSKDSSITSYVIVVDKTKVSKGTPAPGEIPTS